MSSVLVLWAKALLAACSTRSASSARIDVLSSVASTPTSVPASWPTLPGL
ncbi:hypothetical protein I6A62_30445 [Frankia sp. AgW1.1]|nr:hypothetical protein [Frankia sp. AgW1.1]